MEKISKVLLVSSDNDETNKEETPATETKATETKATETKVAETKIAEAEKTFAEEMISSVCSVVYDVVIVAANISEYQWEVERATKRIYEKIGDAYISVKAYEWNFERHRVYATVEIEKAQFFRLDIKDIETQFFSIHAIDEIAYTTPLAQKRKLK